jgi:hypothetical protein
MTHIGGRSTCSPLAARISKCSFTMTASMVEPSTAAAAGCGVLQITLQSCSDGITGERDCSPVSPYCLMSTCCKHQRMRFTYHLAHCVMQTSQDVPSIISLSRVTPHNLTNQDHYLCSHLAVYRRLVSYSHLSTTYCDRKSNQRKNNGRST